MGCDLHAFAALARGLLTADSLAQAAPKGSAAQTTEMEIGGFRPDTRARGSMGQLRAMASMSSRLARRAACSCWSERVGFRAACVKPSQTEPAEARFDAGRL
eukprot:269636-Alexandrium_andersonii.AAC.1